MSFARVTFKWNQLTISRNIFTSHLRLNEQTYYQILGIKQNCSQKEIRSAYLELSKKWHPDKANESNRNEYNSKFQRINEAYNVLNKEIAGIQAPK